MTIKFIFDRLVSFVELLFLWPELVVVAILIKIKMPGGPAFFVQKRVGKGGKLFDCHKFRTMIPVRNNEGVLVYGGAKLYGMGCEQCHAEVHTELLCRSREGWRGCKDQGAIYVPRCNATVSASS